MGREGQGYILQIIDTVTFTFKTITMSQAAMLCSVLLVCSVLVCSCVTHTEARDLMPRDLDIGCVVAVAGGAQTVPEDWCSVTEQARTALNQCLDSAEATCGPSITQGSDLWQDTFRSLREYADDGPAC